METVTWNSTEGQSDYNHYKDTEEDIKLKLRGWVYAIIDSVTLTVLDHRQD